MLKSLVCLLFSSALNAGIGDAISLIRINDEVYDVTCKDGTTSQVPVAEVEKGNVCPTVTTPPVPPAPTVAEWKDEKRGIRWRRLGTEKYFHTNVYNSSTRNETLCLLQGAGWKAPYIDDLDGPVLQSAGQALVNTSGVVATYIDQNKVHPNFAEFVIGMWASLYHPKPNYPHIKDFKGSALMITSTQIKGTNLTAHAHDQSGFTHELNLFCMKEEK